MYVAEHWPERAWGDVRSESAEIRDLLHAMLWRGHAYPDNVTEPPHVVRPVEIVERAKAERKRQETKKKLMANREGA